MSKVKSKTIEHYAVPYASRINTIHIEDILDERYGTLEDQNKRFQSVRSSKKKKFPRLAPALVKGHENIRHFDFGIKVTQTFVILPVEINMCQ